MGSVIPLAASRTERLPRSAEAGAAGVLRVFLFRLTGRDQYALAIDDAGQSLPHDCAGSLTWIFVRPVDLIAGESRLEFDTDEAIRMIQESGCAFVGALCGHD